MTDDAEDLDRRLTRLFKVGPQEDPQEHPSPEKLSAYHAKELSPAEADTIQEHLIQCAFCTDLLLDLQSFLEPEEEDSARGGVAHLGTEAGWRKVREEMGWKGRPAEPSDEVLRLRRVVRGLQALAAVLLMGLMGLSFYSAQILRKMNAPQANSFSLFLLYDEGLRGSEIEPKLIELPRGEEKSITLTLDGNDVADYPEYSAQIRPKRGQSLLSIPGLRKESDSLTFTIGSKGLEPGLYEIELHGLGKGPPARVGYYTFKIDRR